MERSHVTGTPIGDQPATSTPKAPHYGEAPGDPILTSRPQFHGSHCEVGKLPSVVSGSSVARCVSFRSVTVESRVQVRHPLCTEVKPR